jgi:hypothetical protein
VSFSDEDQQHGYRLETRNSEVMSDRRYFNANPELYFYTTSWFLVGSFFSIPFTVRLFCGHSASLTSMQ